MGRKITIKYIQVQGKKFAKNNGKANKCNIDFLWDVARTINNVFI